MNTGKFGRRLQKEAKANPKKAGILALLLAVALYFWAPLIRSWVSKESVPAAPPALPQVALSTEPTSEAIATNKPATQTEPWKQVVEWIEADPRMKTADENWLKRDPFSTSTHQVKAAGWVQRKLLAGLQFAGAPLQRLARLQGTAGAAQVVAAQVREVTPEQAGLAASSTIVGGRRRVALINGKSYSEGSSVAGEGDHATVVFTISRIEARHVVLERLGKQHLLKIPAASLASGGLAGRPQ